METKALASSEAEPEIEEKVYTTASDQALIGAARHDPTAFSTLYRRYVTPVYRYLYRRIGDPAEAEDLTSQVFTEVLEGLIHYRERGIFTAWLFTIAHRKLIATYRRKHRKIPLEEAEDIPGTAEDPLDQVEHNERLDGMAEQFKHLNENQRELLRLRFTAGLGYAEIGAVLGRSEAATKMAVTRLLRRLSSKWEEKS